MIRSFLIGVLATIATSVMATGSGSKPQNGACFALADQAARTCVPVAYSLIDMEVANGQVWAHFEDGLATTTISTYRNDTPKTPGSDEIHDVFASSYSGRKIANGGWTLTAWNLTHNPKIAVLEAVANSDGMNVYNMEIITPHDTMHVVVSDFSPEFENINLDFPELADGIRYSTKFKPPLRLGPFEQLARIND